MKKLAFFDQKHGLTPLEKCDFWHCENFCFYGQKEFVFFLEYYWTLFLVLFLSKRKNEKWDFWDFEKYIFLKSKKVSYLSRTY